MKQQYLRPFLKHLRFLSVTTLIALGSFSAHAGDLTQQRLHFEFALEALQTKDWDNFQQFSTGLQDYPLYYYLRYQYLKPRLKEVPQSEIQAFLRRYGDTYFGDSLRRDWLNQLVKMGDWATFVRFYAPQKSTSLQCHYVQARLMTGRQIRAAVRDAKKLWLVGKSQPKACDPVFEYLYENGQINNTLLWKRISLAMKKSRLSLARALAKRLDPASRAWVTRWQTMHKRPAQTLAEFSEPDVPIVREIILHGIKRLARKQFELANEYWNTFQPHYDFSVQQIGEMQRDLALASVKRDHPEALKWLTAVNKNYLNEKVSQTRIKLAFKRQNWHALLDFVTELPEKERNILRWRYWHARALEQTGKSTQARRMYKKLAKERDYYGFLAADRVRAKYRMRHRPIAFTPTEQATLMKNLSIAGAYEFYQLGQQKSEERKWILNARREWHHALKHINKRQQAVAAALASRWGWHDRAVITAAKAGHYDDLDVRFPLAFYPHFAAGATNQDIDLAWVYGITRQESAFMSKVRSRAGALGLMQLMPATGRLVARKIGLQLRSTRDILDIDTNISLGTAYLRQMLDRFDGNYMLATAAYNAGPGRAKRWAAKNACVPADIWVELIPFNETRNYVRRVLFYTRVFESRLGQRTRPLRVTLAPYNSCASTYIRRNENNPKTPG
ncbi:MAG: hypothetical protein DRR08_30385 [Candidatus Parabeggiatoa sp. nov. 2]|nr:MAG: hypothetical protein B6247_05350 [Beggiatoa sp. 4572_84]RKZ50335.1 MAG: hypothetical protein DRR08_30385 [Gammaproteobacteria bacterium]HEC84432.1 hypothetical protein [Thioploca sp.]